MISNRCLLLLVLIAATACFAGTVPVCQAGPLSNIMFPDATTPCMLGNVQLTLFDPEPSIGVAEVLYFQPDTSNSLRPGFTLTPIFPVTDPANPFFASSQESLYYGNWFSFAYDASIPCASNPLVCNVTNFNHLLTAVTAEAHGYSLDPGANTQVLDATADIYGQTTCNGDISGIFNANAIAGEAIDPYSSTDYGSSNSAAFPCALSEIGGAAETYVYAQPNSVKPSGTATMQSAGFYFNERTPEEFSAGDTGGGTSMDIPSFLRFGAVPEPSSLILLGSGLLGILGTKCRKRRRVIRAKRS